MMKKALISLALCFVANLFAYAQLYTNGEDPGYLKWSKIETDNYRIIYPRGLDSLARVYAFQMELWRDPVSERLGMKPNETYKRKMPVILHSGYAMSNGIVSWAPRQMDIYTVPDAFAPDAMNNFTALAEHESRHVAQMQFSRMGHFKPFYYIFGEMFSGAMSAIYCGQSFLEGDAVQTETILDGGGRGHTADFLEYYRMAFDNGDLRNWYRWRYGSQKLYTPDYYRVGYLTFAGMYERFGVPNFAEIYFDNLFSHKIWFFPFNNRSETTKVILGKTFKETFAEISSYYQEKWREDIVRRGPEMAASQVSETPDFHEEYTGSVFAGGGLHSIRSGLMSAKTMDGRPFSSTTSPLKYSKALDALVWSEVVPDLRWSLLEYSDIFYKPLGSNKHIRLTHKQRYYNPAPSGDGSRIAVTEYPTEGGSKLIILDARNGNVLKSYPAPDNFQIVESAWIGEKLIVSAISDGKFGLYEVTDGQFPCILPPRKHKIKQLWSKEGSLYFTSDETGVNELYRYNDGAFKKMTNTRYGASEFAFDDQDEWLYFSELTPDGRLVHKTAAEDLPVKDFDFQEVKDTISRQPESREFAISEPEKYSKVGNLFHFHSWAPVYFNPDGATDGTFDELHKIANIGATAMFQNNLGTMSGMVGYSLHKGNGGYVNLTYTGLYPVFAGQINFGGKVFNGHVQTYVPLDLSSGGWYRGIRPRATYSWYGSGNSNLEIAVRGYTVRPIASSGIYPRWGIGAETGFNSMDGEIYQYIYGYVPGFIPQHGLKLSANVSHFNDGSFFSYFTADYGMALFPIDWAGLSPVAYVRNFETTIHFQMDRQDKQNSIGIGGSFVARLGNFLWAPFDTRIGVSYLYDSYYSKSFWNLVLNIDI